MKFAIMKIGARFKESDNISVYAHESIVVGTILQNRGHEVIYVTDVKESDPTPVKMKIIDYDEYFVRAHEFDALLVMGGLTGFYGGLPASREPDIYKAMNNFPKEGQVYWVQTEIRASYHNNLNAVFNKSWGHSYKHHDIRIREKSVRHLTQFKNVDAYKFFGKITAEYFPFEKFTLYEYCNKELTDIDYSKCEYDLVYGGSFRFGSREEEMVKYFFGLPNDISMYVFGMIEECQFTIQGNKRPPTFGKSVKYNKYGETLQKGWCSITPGDKNCQKIDHLTVRTYENVVHGLVAFIDTEFDPNKRIFSHPTLRKFLYVSTQSELINRIRHLKQHPEKIKKIVDLQRQDLFGNFSKEQYEKDFENIFLKYKDDWKPCPYNNNVPTPPYDFNKIPEILSKHYCKVHGLVWREDLYVVNDEREGKEADLSMFEKIPDFDPTKVKKRKRSHHMVIKDDVE